MPNVEMKLVGDDGVEVADKGEIWVRCPNLMTGYWDDTGSTAATITQDGWLMTGDVAVVDASGHYSVVDRKKVGFSPHRSLHDG
jgi:long-subunit acyl-CoA synthetase (AMP-forming)